MLSLRKFNVVRRKSMVAFKIKVLFLSSRNTIIIEQGVGHLQIGLIETVPIKGDMKSYKKIVFVSATKIGEDTTNILNCCFSS